MQNVHDFISISNQIGRFGLNGKTTIKLLYFLSSQHLDGKTTINYITSADKVMLPCLNLGVLDNYATI